MMRYIRPILTGLFGSLVLLAISVGVETLISGWDFVLSQFSSFWYFMLLLAGGFGVQVSL